MLWDAWACWLHFSCSRLRFGFPIFSQLLAQMEQDPGGVIGECLPFAEGTDANH